MYEYGLIIVEKTQAERTIVGTVTKHDFEDRILPRLTKKHGILKLGSNKIDLTHVTKWVFFESRNEKRKVIARS